MAKNNGANIICNFSTYSSTLFIILVLATAMPTAKAPTIGDKSINTATAAAPKKLAVVIPSILPLYFHSFSTCRILGTMRTEPISKAYYNFMQDLSSFFIFKMVISKETHAINLDSLIE
jgi:hypothetical protein